jgi:hypothetical protein
MPAGVNAAIASGNILLDIKTLDINILLGIFIVCNQAAIL